MNNQTVMTGPELREWMGTNGWSIRKLAAALGIGDRTMMRYRSGESPIPRPVELALSTVHAEREAAVA